jgi:hypothetical protein
MRVLRVERQGSGGTGPLDPICGSMKGPLGPIRTRCLKSIMVRRPGRASPIPHLRSFPVSRRFHGEQCRIEPALPRPEPFPGPVPWFSQAVSTGQCRRATNDPLKTRPTPCMHHG